MKDAAQDVAEDVVGARRTGAWRCDAQGWSRAHPARPARTASSSSHQAPFERLKPAVGAAGPVAVAVDT